MKFVVIAVIGSVTFATAGVCIYIYSPRPLRTEKDYPNFDNIRDNIQVWMYQAYIYVACNMVEYVFMTEAA